MRRFVTVALIAVVGLATQLSGAVKASAETFVSSSQTSVTLLGPGALTSGITCNGTAYLDVYAETPPSPLRYVAYSRVGSCSGTMAVMTETETWSLLVAGGAVKVEQSSATPGSCTNCTTATASGFDQTNVPGQVYELAWTDDWQTLPGWTFDSWTPNCTELTSSHLQCSGFTDIVMP